MHIKIIIILGNIASANTENDSAQKEPSNRSSEINILGSETFNVESDRYKNERGFLYFFKFFTTCLVKFKILHFGQLTRTNALLLTMMN